MEIGAYIAPSISFLDTYTGANFNKYTIVIPAKTDGGNGYIPSYTQEQLISMLNKCQEKGIDVQIQLPESLLSAGYNVFTQAYSGIDFKDYSSVKGFFIADEPTWGQIEIIDETYASWYNQNYANSDIEFYVNLLGGYSSAIGPVRDANGNILYDENGYALYNDATEEQKEICYQAYVEKWLGVFNKINSKVKFFTIDAYPFGDNQPGKIVVADVVDSTDENALTAEQLYEKLAKRLGEDCVLNELPAEYERYVGTSWLYLNYKAANNAKKNSMIFGAYMQAFDEGGNAEVHNTRTYRLPTTLAEMKWQAYMNIAFGAKKLVYYGYDYTDNGTYMTEEGKPTPLYTLVQQTNEELLKVDHVFAAFTNWVGVKTFLGENSAQNEAFDKIAEMELDQLTGVSGVTSSRDLLVGEMVDGEGRRGYMLVGYDDPFYGNKTEVSMTFEDAKGVIIYRNGQRSLSEDLVDGTFTVTLEAGEGVFVIPVY